MACGPCKTKGPSGPLFFVLHLSARASNQHIARFSYNPENHTPTTRRGCNNYRPRKPGSMSPPQNEENAMLKYAIIFTLISLVAGALGFTGVAAGAAGIAKVLFFVFLVLAVIFVVLAVKAAGAVSKALK